MFLNQKSRNWMESSDLITLLYLIYKFPNVKNLYLDVHNGSDPIELNLDALKLFLNYLSGVNSFSVFNIRDSFFNIDDAVADYWESTEMEGEAKVEITYARRADEAATFLDIYRDNRNEPICFTFRYVSQSWMHKEFMELNGKYIGDLTFKLQPTDNNPPENLVYFILKQWPNRRTIRPQHCRLSASSSHSVVQSMVDLKGGVYLNKLSFAFSTIYLGMLEQLSFVLSETKVLHFKCTEYRINANLETSMLEIIMPNTKVNTIVFEELLPCKAYYFKVFAFREKVESYFEYHGNVVESCTEVDYRNAIDSENVYTCCQREPIVQIL